MKKEGSALQALTASVQEKESYLNSHPRGPVD